MEKTPEEIAKEEAEEAAAEAAEKLVQDAAEVTVNAATEAAPEGREFHDPKASPNLCDLIEKDEGGNFKLEVSAKDLISHDTY